jgi:uncharacterized spore protein YtfJ
MTLVERMQEKFTARIVYGEPIEKDGAVLLPAVWVAGGGGGGSEVGDEDGLERGGGGFGLFARPSGSWVVTGDGARWVPAVDLTAVVVAASLVAMSMIRYRAKTR